MWSRIGFLISLGLVAGLGLSSSERVRYENYSLYTVKASNQAELAVLKDLQSSSDSLIFMTDVNKFGDYIPVVVAPHKDHDFKLVLENNKIEHKLVEKNVQKLLDEEIAEMSLKKPEIQARSFANDELEAPPEEYKYNWQNYFNLDDTYIWLLNLTMEFPTIVLPIDAGKTYERNTILGVKVSFDKGQTEKPGIFLEGGIHAREWISPATVTFILNNLLRSKNEAVREMARKYDWYIVPIANPDGYNFTHTTNRLWRKTRSPQGSCFGVDPNRNWDFHWDEAGTSSDPCDDTFSGKKAFSEIETLSLARYIASLKGKIQLYLSFHSYSQLLLFPYGHTSEKAPNHDDLNQIFKVTTEAISKRYGTKYTGGNIHDAIYPASGASIEWAYGKQDIKLAYTYELRPRSNAIFTGFRLPADQIQPTGEETLDSIMAMVNEAERLGYMKLK